MKIVHGPKGHRHEAGKVPVIVKPKVQRQNLRPANGRAAGIDLVAMVGNSLKGESARHTPVPRSEGYPSTPVVPKHRLSKHEQKTIEFRQLVDGLAPNQLKRIYKTPTGVDPRQTYNIGVTGGPIGEVLFFMEHFGQEIGRFVSEVGDKRYLRRELGEVAPLWFEIKAGARGAS